MATTPSSQPASPSAARAIVPYLVYGDAPAAIDFLCAAFGFAEVFRYAMDDGRIGHAELAAPGGAAVYLASAWPDLGLVPPHQLAGVPAQLYCWVDDVDAHHARARAAGATIAAAPADTPYGERAYRAIDPEGHRWIFAARRGGS